MDEKRQIQKELFDEFSSAERKRHPRDLLTPKAKKSIWVSYEHLIFVIMAIILVGIVCFSLGVEQGRRKVLMTREIDIQVQELPSSSTQHIAKMEVPEVIHDKTENITPVAQPVQEGPFYMVQVASFHKAEFAEKEVKRLSKKGYEPYFLKSDPYYVVCVGKEKDSEDLLTLKKQLHKIYPDCFIKKR